MGASCSCLDSGQLSARKDNNQPLEVIEVLIHRFAL